MCAYLVHSKGPWKQHKYITKENGKYVYTTAVTNNRYKITLPNTNATANKLSAKYSAARSGTSGSGRSSSGSSGSQIDYREQAAAEAAAAQEKKKAASTRTKAQKVADGLNALNRILGKNSSVSVNGQEKTNELAKNLTDKASQSYDKLKSESVDKYKSGTLRGEQYVKDVIDKFKKKNAARLS